MNDNKNIIVALAIAFLSIIFIFWALSGKKDESRTERYIADKPAAEKWQKKDDMSSQTGRITVSGRSFASGKGTASPFSEEEKAKMLERNAEVDKLLNEAATNWLFSKANDDSLPPKTREKYKLKLNTAYVEASMAKKRKDYPQAIKKFYEAIKAPDSTPVSKYYSLLNIKTIALKMKDMDLFIVASKMEARLMAEEDLSAIGITKSEEHLEWVESFEKLLNARKDPAILNDLVQKRMEFQKGKYSREDVEKMIFLEADRYEAIFKELMG
ncbi:MAG: hypothetical protein EOM80_12405 [Erysipelotrichia bacterium]|nr:hypothetical protein [Erysipelotrichia bacterium]